MIHSFSCQLFCFFIVCVTSICQGNIKSSFKEPSNKIDCRIVHSVHCIPNPSQVPSYLKHCGAIIAVNPLLPHHHLMIINHDGDGIRKVIMICKATLLVLFFLGFVWDSLPSLSTFPNCLLQVVFSSIPYYMHAEGSML